MRVHQACLRTCPVQYRPLPPQGPWHCESAPATAALRWSACCEGAAACLQCVAVLFRSSHHQRTRKVSLCQSARLHREADYYAMMRVSVPVNLTSGIFAVPAAVPASSCSGAAHPQHENTAPAPTVEMHSSLDCRQSTCIWAPVCVKAGLSHTHFSSSCQERTAASIPDLMLDLRGTTSHYKCREAGESKDDALQWFAQGSQRCESLQQQRLHLHQLPSPAFGWRATRRLNAAALCSS